MAENTYTRAYKEFMRAYRFAEIDECRHFILPTDWPAKKAAKTRQQS